MMTEIDITSLVVVATCVYKIACLFVGLAMAFMGYKLFLTRYQWDTSDAKISLKDFGLSIKKTAPGTFFVLFGTAIICFTVWKGIQSDLSPTTRTRISNPLPKLPSKPPEK
jgi:hypothetical protein